MKKRTKAKIIRCIFTAFFCTLTVLLIVVQARNNNGQKVYVSAKSESYYQTTIEGEQKDLEALQQRLKEARAELDEYKEWMKSDEQESKPIEDKIKEEAALYGAETGALAVEGPGISISIDDGSRELNPWENPNDVLVHDGDLLMVLNELKEAGAEAISINSERIIDTTSISCAGYTVRINGRTFARPFTINAIGDPARMSSAMLGPLGPITELDDYLQVKLTVQDRIVIQPASNIGEFKYARRVSG